MGLIISKLQNELGGRRREREGKMTWSKMTDRGRNSVLKRDTREIHRGSERDRERERKGKSCQKER
jgi:predicted Fe-S protein YdhL (DUF1289 family)